MSIYEIITQGQKDGKTLAEINADLAAAGYQTAFGDKDGNAFLDSGVGEPEPCSVEGGKLTSCKAVPHQDIVLYDGEQYHVDDDGVTLIAMPSEEEPWWVPYHTYGGLVKDWRDELPQYIPKKEMMFRPEYAGKKVEKGKLLYRYDSEGNATYEPISMRDYDEDHQR